MSGHGICVIGNLNMDLIIRQVPRLPVWGQEVVGTSHTLVSAGQAGYLAFALARLGDPVSVIANVGSDIFGQQIVHDLRRAGVNVDGVETAERETGISVAIVRPDGERAFVSNLGCLNVFDEGLVERAWGQTAGADIVCLVGSSVLGALSAAASAGILARARAAGQITAFDPGWDPNGWPQETIAATRALLRHVTAFLPNQDEARALTGHDDPAAAAAALAADGPEIVVVKCGAAGSVARRGDETVHLPARPVAVYDAVGAGDTFNAGFLAGLGRGWPLLACLAFGSAAASLYISRAADRFPTWAEVTAAARDFALPQGAPFAEGDDL